jgi:mono/diheme cytochrome c family protein
MYMRLAVFLLVTSAPGLLSAQSTTKVKIVPVKQTSAASASDMFSNYCAACHGKEGKGDGPAAAAFKIPPADLTTIATRNNGTFDDLKVMQSIAGEGLITAHGSLEMPIWGDVLKSLDPNKSLSTMRLVNLTSYIKSIQK